MSPAYEELPDHIREHLAEVRRSSGLPETGESLERLASAWRQKKRLFMEQARLLGMIEIPGLRRDSPQGALVLTHSGSLISLGPLQAGGDGSIRRAEYASIELRQDVPRFSITEAARLTRDVAPEKPLEFEAGPVRSTSPVLCLFSFGPEVGREEQARRIYEATLFLTNGFAKINRTVLAVGEELPDHFNLQTIVRSVASRNGLTQRQTRQVIEDYTHLLEAGMLMGERVPLGRLGRLFLRRRPARKARMGLNPATGERLLIPAQPDTWVPRVSFSTAIRARAAAVPLEPEAGAPEAKAPDSRAGE